VIRLVLVGYGQMGRAVEEAARQADDVEIKARFDLTPNPGPGAESSEYQDGAAGVLPIAKLGATLAAGDVVIEFSGPEGARNAAARCAEWGAALVSGSTGLTAEDEAAIRAAAGRIPVLRSANFSLGVMALKRVLGTALACVPGDWNLEIVERHHRRKVDSPSGTALMLAREAARLRGYSAESVRSGRSGRSGPRPDHEIGVHAVRGGSWIGDHQILLAGEGEWLELRHVAQSRAAFAQGALAAARFVVQKAPSLYTLDDIAPSGRTM
jgi:4-hydroxy-tetrahydrodipicolinate reductase